MAMITTSEGWRSERVFRFTLLVSVLLHLIVGVFAFHTFDMVARMLAVHDKSKDEIVTISSAITIAKKPKPVPVSRPVRPQRPTPRVQPQPRVAPQPQQVAQLPKLELPKPVFAPPTPARHELAKVVAHGSPQPPRTATASPAPVVQAPPKKEPQQVALAQRPSQAQPRSVSAPMSQERLAQIERELAQTIAQARGAHDPLRAVPHETPAAPKHYRIQMEGETGDLRHGEGYYYPVQSWRAEGYDYYYVAYEFTYADGLYETGNVPWPIRFSPRADPFAHPEIGALHRTPLPPPLPGWELTPQLAAHLGKALRVYFPSTTFTE